MPGLLLDKKEQYAYMVTDSCEFKRIRLLVDASIGCELTDDDYIEIPNKKRMLGGFGKYCIAAGVLLASVASYGAFRNYTQHDIIAYIGVDGKQSIELGVDAQGKVQEVTANDAQSKKMIANVNVDNRSVSDVTSDITAKAAKAGKKGSNLLITVSSNQKSGGNTAKMAAEVKDATVKKLQKANIDANVDTMTTDSTVRDKAKEAGLSTGKYVIMMKAQEEGLEIDPTEMKNATPQDAVKNAGGNPQTIIDKAQKDGVSKTVTPSATTVETKQP